MAVDRSLSLPKKSLFISARARKVCRCCGPTRAAPDKTPCQGASVPTNSRPDTSSARPARLAPSVPNSAAVWHYRLALTGMRRHIVLAIVQMAARARRHASLEILTRRSSAHPSIARSRAETLCPRCADTSWHHKSTTRTACRCPSGSNRQATPPRGTGCVRVGIARDDCLAPMSARCGPITQSGRSESM